jgi:hypothetical protein
MMETGARGSHGSSREFDGRKETMRMHCDRDGDDSNVKAESRALLQAYQYAYYACTCWRQPRSAKIMPCAARQSARNKMVLRKQSMSGCGRFKGVATSTSHHDHPRTISEDSEKGHDDIPLALKRGYRDQ